MHKRRTAKSINKPPPIQGAIKKPTPVAEPPPVDANFVPQFELELCWCVQQLQSALESGNLGQKVAEDTAKNIKVLTSSTAPLVKKRVVMKLALGDYRAKMQQEEQILALASRQIKFTPTTEASKKSSFVKKSALLTSGKDFRFNFPSPAEDTNSNEPHPANDFNPSSIQPVEPGSPFKFNFTIAEDSANDISFSSLNLNK